MDFRQGLLALALAIACLTPSALPAPHSVQQRGQSCQPAVCRHSHESHLKYQEGKTYTYAYETEVQTQLVGSSDEISRIKVKGQATLVPQSPCDFVLALTSLSIQSPSGQAITHLGGEHVEGSSIRFSLQDGVIETLCVSNDDPTWSANIKRALASKLQNKGLWSESNGEVIEMDISGRCPTEYYKEGSNKWVKTRDLNRCSHREGGASVFNGVPYNVPLSSSYNSAPLVNSTLQCEQELRNGIYQQVVCEEKHQLKPMSNDEAGIKSVIKSSMRFVSDSDSQQQRQSGPWTHSSIFFDHSEMDDKTKQKNSANAALETLNKLCLEVSEGIVTAKVPGLFLQLKKFVRTTRRDDLKEMYDQITSGKLCSSNSGQDKKSSGQEKIMKLFLDALAMSASDGSIALFSEILTNHPDRIDWETKQTFFIYTPFAPRPGHLALKAIDSLLSSASKDNEKEILLAASGLAHQYCKMTNRDCLENEEYSALVDQIARFVHDFKDSNKDRVIAGLQALGNLDQLTPNAVSSIQRILQVQKKRSLEGHWLKVRALEAFRRDPCQRELKEDATQILKDLSESSELRIQSYLAVMRCGSEHDVEQVEKMLNVEKSNQVGSFITSHIDNIMKSSNPSRKQLKNALGRVRISREFPNDPRKFSKNFETSYFRSEMNMGGSAEGNVIFSQDSFVPRTTSANLTLDLFGRSYNVLEVGAYLEDFEHMIEEYFGPSGKVRRTNMNDIVKQSKKNWRSFRSDLGSRIRRSVSSSENSDDSQESQELDQNDIEYYHKQVNRGESWGKNGQGDFYMRILGTSIMVETFDESRVKSRSMRSKVLKVVDRMMEGAKDHKFDMTEPFSFIDEEIIIPTMSGWPINLAIEGTAVLSLQLKGNMDIKQMFSSSSSDLKTRILPSAATLIKAKMTVGTGPIESGIQVEGKIHTASGIDVSIVRERGEFELKMNLPQERIQLIDIKSNLYWIESSTDLQEKKTAIKMTSSQSPQMVNDCTSKYANIFGLKVCSDVTIPSGRGSSPYFPLTGPTVLSLAIEKVDKSMEGYYIKVASKSEKHREHLLSIVLDTPGSKINRKIEATGQYTEERNNPRLKIDIESPWEKLEMIYQKWNNANLRGYELDAKIGQSPYSAKAILKRQADIYEPVVEYSTPSRTFTLLDGKVVKGNNEMDFELRIGGQTPETIRGYNIGHSFKGIVKVQPDSRWSRPGDIRLENIELISNELGKIKLDGTATMKPHHYGIDIQTKWGKDAQNDLSLMTKYHKESNKKGSFEAKMQSTKAEYLNFNIDYQWIQPSNKHWESQMKASRGISEADKFSISSRQIYDLESSKSFKVLNEIKVLHPKRNINFQLKVNADNKNGQRNGQFLLISGEKLEARAQFEETNNGKYQYELKSMARYEQNKLEFSEIAEQIDANTWNFKSIFEKTPGHKWEADTQFIYDVENRRNMHQEISSKITSTSLKQPIIFKAGFNRKSDKYDAELRVEAKGENYVEFTSDFNMEKRSKVGNLKAFVKNYLQSELQLTDDSNKSTLKMEAKWIPTGRKIEGKSELELQGQNLNWLADLKWDAERNPSKSIVIRSESSFARSAQWIVNSKNEITIQGKKSRLEVNGQVARDYLNGDHSVQMSYQSPKGSNYNLSIKNTLENRQTRSGSKLEGSLSIPQASGPYEIMWENRASNINRREYLFDVLTELKVSGPYRGKQEDLKLKVALANRKPGNYRSYSSQMEIGGSIIDQPISSDYSLELKQGLISLQASGKKGSKNGGLKVDIEHDTYSTKKRFGVIYKIETPYRDAKTVEGKYRMTYFFKSWRNFEITEVVESSLNGADLGKSSYSIRLHENEFEFKDEIAVGGRQFVQILVNGRKDRNKFTTTVQTTIDGQSSRLNAEMDNQFPSAITVRLGGQTPYIANNKEFELNMNHRSLSGVHHSYSIDADARLGQKSIKIINKLELSPQRKTIDAGITASDQPSRRLFLTLEESEKSKWNYEALAKWGNGGKIIKSKGNLARLSEGNYDASISFDYPEINADKWNARVSKKLSNGRHSITLSAEGAQKKVGSIGLEYARKETRSGVHTYDGSVKVEAPQRAIDFTGNFRVEDTRLERKRDNEVGRQLMSSVQLVSDRYPLKFEVLLKNSNLDKQIQTTFCTQNNDDCNIVELQYKHMKESNRDDSDWVMKALVKSRDGPKTSVDGIQLNMRKSENSQKIEQTAQLIFGQEKERNLGYRLWRDGTEFGSDIILPERTISVNMKGEMERESRNAEINLWMDKERQPEKKISINVDVDTKSRSSDNGHGKSMRVLIKHPEMKDMQVSAKYIRGGSKILFDGELVLDLFKAGQEIQLKSNILRESSQSYKLEGVLRSKGQDIDVQFESEILKTDEEFKANTEVTWSNRARQSRSSRIELQVNRGEFNLEWNGAQEPILKIATNWNDLGSTRNDMSSEDIELRHEMLLPGMKDASIYQMRISPSYPSQARIKVFKSTEGGEYYEAFFGLKNRKHFSAGIYEQTQSGRDIIADFDVALNNTRLLFVKADWERQNVRKALKYGQERLEINADNLKDVSSQSWRELTEEIMQVAKNMRTSIPSYSKLASSFENEIDEIQNEMSNSKDIQQIRAYFDIAGMLMEDYFGAVWEKLEKSGRFVRRVARKVQEAVKQIPDMVEEMGELYPQLSDLTIQIYREIIDAMVETARRSSQRMNDVLDWLSSQNPDWVQNILNDSSKGFGKFLKKAMAKSLEIVTEGWREMRSLLQETWERPEVREALKKIAIKYEDVAADALDEVKDQAKALKNWLLRNLPAKEAQELIQAVADYVENKAKQVNIDDSAAQRDIYDKLIKAIRRFTTDVLTVDLRNGLIIAQIPLPKDVDSLEELKELSTISLPRRSLSSSRREGRYTSPSKMSLGMDQIINSMRNRGRDALETTTDAWALLVGSQYFRTFDGHVYNFKGNCQYLLTSDFVDRNFSVVLDYHNDNTKSIIVTDHKDTVVLKQDSTVLANNKVVQLPMTVGPFKIVREWDSIVVKSNGLRVSCGVSEDVCAFQLSGYYHGKTNGLLGTYNNEVYDDLTKSTGQIAENARDMASSWRLGKQCNEKPVPEHTHDISSSLRQKCTEAFSSRSSTLRPCFSVVEPTAFQSICEALGGNDREMDEHKALCTVSHAYMKACEFQDIKVNNLPNCVSCSRSGNQMSFGERQKMNDNMDMNKADIIIVREKRQCSNEFSENALPTLQKSIQEDLALYGVQDIAFGLIEFDQNGRPEVHTNLRSGNNVEIHDMLSSNIKAASERRSQDSSDSDSNESNEDKNQRQAKVLKAIEKAIEFPYRAGSNKAIVLISCSDCSEDSKTSYSTIRDELREKHIRLHVISPSAIRSSQNNQQEREIIGFNATATFSYSDAHKHGQEVGDRSNRKYISSEKRDMCTRMANEVSGSWFSLERYNEEKRGSENQRKFAQIIGSRVASDLQANKSKCFNCQCGTVSTASRLQCTPCLRQPYVPIVGAV